MKSRNLKNEQQIQKGDAYLQKLVKLIVKHYDPKKIYLFGSKARGDAHPDSDYDLLVVLKRKMSWEQEKSFAVDRWKKRLLETTDIVYWTEKSFEEHLALSDSLPAIVEQEGQLLYAAV